MTDSDLQDTGYPWGDVNILEISCQIILTFCEKKRGKGESSLPFHFVFPRLTDAGANRPLPNPIHLE